MLGFEAQGPFRAIWSGAEGYHIIMWVVVKIYNTSMYNMVTYDHIIMSIPEQLSPKSGPPKPAASAARDASGT